MSHTNNACFREKVFFFISFKTKIKEYISFQSNDLFHNQIILIKYILNEAFMLCTLINI